MQGLIDSALQLDETCHVVLVTSSRLALEKAAVGEGLNRDLIYELYRVLTSKGCTYTFNFREGQGTDKQRYPYSRTLTYVSTALQDRQPAKIITFYQ